MLNVRKIEPLLRIVGSASAIVVRADLFLNRPVCVGSAWVGTHDGCKMRLLVKRCCGTVGAGLFLVCVASPSLDSMNPEPSLDGARGTFPKCVGTCHGHKVDTAPPTVKAHWRLR